MKNYFNLEQLIPINGKKFIETYKSSKASLEGCIYVFGGSFGRPGDVVEYLKHIDLFDKEVRFEFKGITIIVKDPKYFYLNEKMIAIKSCKSIIWDEYRTSNKVEYIVCPQHGKVTVNVITGTSKPRFDEKASCCFMLAQE